MERKLIRNFNIIDLLIIAAIVVSAAALIYKLTLDGRNRATEYVFTYVCEKAPYSLLEDIQAGQQCTDRETGKPFGTVTTCVIERSDSRSGSGIITVAVNGVQAEHGVSVNESVYLKGQTAGIIIGDSLLEVYLENIEPAQGKDFLF